MLSHLFRILPKPQITPPRTFLFKPFHPFAIAQTAFRTPNLQQTEIHKNPTIHITRKPFLDIPIDPS